MEFISIISDHYCNFFPGKQFNEYSQIQLGTTNNSAEP